MKTKINWTPIRRGKIYCSSACGGNCTWAAYQLAKRCAAAMVKELGPNWKPHVYENLGWHYQVDSEDGHISVHNRPSTGEYWAAIDGYWSADGKTPSLAVSAAAARTRRHLEQLTRTLSDVEKMYAERACKHPEGRMGHFKRAGARL